jgi:hypothetical protein
MTTFEREIEDIEKLVEQVPLVNLDVTGLKRRVTKRHARKLAKPHIRAHRVKDSVYYTYCRGADKEVYLGDADSILRAVKGDN